jgi:hypothetical protein
MMCGDYAKIQWYRRRLCGEYWGGIVASVDLPDALRGGERGLPEAALRHPISMSAVPARQRRAQ